MDCKSKLTNLFIIIFFVQYLFSGVRPRGKLFGGKTNTQKCIGLQKAFFARE